ncbi:MAG TPA: diadenylate cyclase [Myxococcus sp.]|nr:diadenylate cyclase [Myxococcus sp.]
MTKTKRQIRQDSDTYEWLLKQFLQEDIKKSHHDHFFDDPFSPSFGASQVVSPIAERLLEWTRTTSSSSTAQHQFLQDILSAAPVETLWSLTGDLNFTTIENLILAEIATRKGLIAGWEFLGLDQNLADFTLNLKEPLDELILRFSDDPFREGFIYGQPCTAAPYFFITHVLQLLFVDGKSETFEVSLRSSGDAPTRGEFLSDSGSPTWQLTASGWLYESRSVSKGLIDGRPLTKFRVMRYRPEEENQDTLDMEDSFFQHRKTLDQRLPTHLQILAQELNLNNVQLPDLPKNLKRTFFEELHRSLKPHIHEGRVPPFCVALLKKPKLLKQASKVVPVTPEELESIAKLANGSRALVAYTSRKKIFLLAFKRDITPESELVKLSSANSAVIIRRTSDNETRIYNNGAVTIHKDRNWLFKESSKSAVDLVMQQAPMANRQVLEKILDYAHHVLNPRRIGATLIWNLRESSIEGGQPIGMDLSIMRAVDQYLLTEFLAQTDGATSIRFDGSIESSGIHLIYSDKSRSIIQEVGGTRHTSARRFSYDHPESIAVVVSSDGPVSVFSDGIKVASLVMHSWSSYSVASALRDAVPEKAEDVIQEDWKATCAHCGKTALINEIFIYGWREDETARCPVCGVEIANSRCFSLSAVPLKVLL